MPTKPVPLSGFKGMDNIREFAIDLASPRVILNAVVRPDGKIKKRQGFTKLLSLTAGHSLWATQRSAFMFLADGSTLYYSDGVTKTSLGAIGVPQEPLYYTEVNDTVYLGNSIWNGAIDLKTYSLRSWGLALPNQPVLSAAAGNLPPGRYAVCLTSSSDGRISGSGVIAQIVLSVEGGIAISNLTAGDIIWMTEPNGEKFFFAGLASPVVALPSVTDVLPSLWCTPPLNMENLALGHGRIWGTVKEFLYYSMPLAYEWFRINSDFFYFPKDITMVAPVAGGVYVGFEDETVFLAGKKVAEMAPLRVGDGVVRGSLAYADNFGNYKNSSLSMLGNLDAGIPIWLGRFGIFAGMHNGTVIELTSRRIKYDAGRKAASLFRMVEGEPQYMVGTPQGNTVAFGDTVTCEVIRNGRVFLGDYVDEPNDSVQFAESVSATIT